MARRSGVGFEWQVVDGDLPDEPQATESGGRSRLRARLARWLIPLLALAIGVGLLVVGGRAWWEQQAQKRTQGELETLLLAEQRAFEQGDEQRFATLLDTKAARGWRGQEQTRIRLYGEIPDWIPWQRSALVRRVGSIKVQGDRAEAAVQSQWGDGHPTFDQTLFFRKGDDGRWLISAPDAERWGTSRHMQTLRLDLEFQARDARTIEAAAPALEAAAEQIEGDLRLPDMPAPPQSRLTIAFVPRSYNLAPPTSGGRIELPSPELVGVEAGVPQTAQVVRQVTRAMAERKIATLRRGPWRSFPSTTDVEMLLQVYPMWAAEMTAPPRPWLMAEMQAVLRDAVGRGRNLDPDAWLEGGPNAHTLHMAHAFFLLSFLSEHHGRESLGPLFHSLSMGLGWSSSIAATLKMPYADFVVEWRSALTQMIEVP